MATETVGQVGWTHWPSHVSVWRGVVVLTAGRRTRFRHRNGTVVVVGSRRSTTSSSADTPPATTSVYIAGEWLVWLFHWHTKEHTWVVKRTLKTLTFCINWTRKLYLDDGVRPQVSLLVLCKSVILHRRNPQILSSLLGIWLGLGNMANLELLHLQVGWDQRRENENKTNNPTLAIYPTSLVNGKQKASVGGGQQTRATLPLSNPDSVTTQASTHCALHASRAGWK